MKFTLYIAALAVVFYMPVNLSGQSSSDQNWANIQDLVQEGNDTEAIRLLDLLDVAPMDSLRYYKAKSGCFYRLGDYYNAKRNAELVLGFNPEDKTILRQLGSIYDTELNLPKAIKYYSKLLETDTTNPSYYKLNALMQMKAGFKPQAFKYFAKAYYLNPKDVVVVSQLTDLLLESEQFEQVDSILNIASQQDSTNIKIILAKARSKYQQKDYASVIYQIEKTFGKIDLPEYYIKMAGYSYLQIDSVDQAIYWLERLLHADQKEFVHYYLAIAYDKKGEKEASLFHYDQAIQKSISESVDLYYAEAAQILEDEGDLRKAIKYLQEAAHFDPKPKYFYYLAVLSDTYYKDKSIALRYFEQYIKTNDKHPTFMDYARKKAKYLKEQIHFSNNSSN